MPIKPKIHKTQVIELSDEDFNTEVEAEPITSLVPVGTNYQDTKDEQPTIVPEYEEMGILASGPTPRLVEREIFDKPIHKPIKTKVRITNEDYFNKHQDEYNLFVKWADIALKENKTASPKTLVELVRYHEGVTINHEYATYFSQKAAIANPALEIVFDKTKRTTPTTEITPNGEKHD